MKKYEVFRFKNFNLEANIIRVEDNDDIYFEAKGWDNNGEAWYNAKIIPRIYKKYSTAVKKVEKYLKITNNKNEKQI